MVRQGQYLEQGTTGKPRSSTGPGRVGRLAEGVVLFVGLPVLLLLVPGIPMWLLLWLTAGLCALALGADPNFDRASFFIPASSAILGSSVCDPSLCPWSCAVQWRPCCSICLCSLSCRAFSLCCRASGPACGCRYCSSIHCWMYIRRGCSTAPFSSSAIVPSVVPPGYWGYSQCPSFCLLPWCMHLPQLGGSAPHLPWWAVFARTYQHTRPTLVVVLEHTLYGWLLFTIGMGRFFYLAGVDSLPVLFRF
jgi:hypothetical protein